MYHTLRELTLLECHYLDNRSMIQIKLIINVSKSSGENECKHYKILFYPKFQIFENQ
jgi:hypothetical protein